MADKAHNSLETQLSEHPVLLFDGVCNLCNASVQWVLLRDKAGIFHFAALQSDMGHALLGRHGLLTDNFDTVVLVDQGRVFLSSDVPLEIVRRLGGFWQIFYVFKIVPHPMRDTVYTWIALNRYRWFVQRVSCM